MKRRNQNSESNWVSFSDIMTGLMVIFMFIAISYIIEVQKNNEKIKKTNDIIAAIINDFLKTKEELHKELEEEFEKDFADWQVTLDKDLSIKFTNPDFLFDMGKHEIRSEFSKILSEFLPRYFDILRKYNDKISEIRIEGHTDTIAAKNLDADPYIGNVMLSQRRATEVMKFFTQSEYFSQLKPIEVKRLQFLLTANGLSFGRTVDENFQLTFISKKPIDMKNSKRVEFRIVTTSEKVVEEIKKLQSGTL